MRCSKSRYYSDLELVGTFEKIAKSTFFEVAFKGELVNFAAMQ